MRALFESLWRSAYFAGAFGGIVVGALVSVVHPRGWVVEVVTTLIAAIVILGGLNLGDRFIDKSKLGSSSTDTHA